MVTQRKIDLTEQFRDAQFRSTSFDETTNEINVVFTSGAIVRRRSWRDGGLYDEELVVMPDAVNLERLNGGAAPFLNSHLDGDLSTVIGSVKAGSARIANGEGTATVRLSSAPADRDVVHKIREGIIRSISVGYTTDRIEIEQRDGDVPLWRVTRWTPLELSAVAVPADAGAQIRSAARAYSAEIVTARPVLRKPDRFVVEPKTTIIF